MILNKVPFVDHKYWSKFDLMAVQFNYLSAVEVMETFMKRLLCLSMSTSSLYWNPFVAHSKYGSLAGSWNDVNHPKGE
jgi:hypothetical protein